MKRLLLLSTSVFLISCTQQGPDTGYTGFAPSPEVLPYMLEGREIMEAIILGGEWFLAHESDEFLHYKYLPYKARYADDNNEVRKLGALWSLTALWHYLQDDRYEVLARKGLDHFVPMLEEHPGGILSLVINGYAKLAYPSFLIYSLTAMPDYPDRDATLIALGDTIVNAQREDGSYDTYLLSERTGGEDFYPGEANLALMILYQYTDNTKYRDAVAKSFPFYRDRWRGNHALAFIPWQTQAYGRLYQSDPRPEYRDFVFEMNDFLVSVQQTTGNYSKPKFVGGFKFPTPGISTSSYMEGLLDAFVLARDAGDRARIQSYGNASVLGANFLIGLQFQDDNTYKLDTLDELVRGGFRQSRNNSNLRIDNNQHAVMALMKVYEQGLW